MTTTKIVAAVITKEGSDPILERWVGTKLSNSPKVQRQIREFFEKHRVNSLVTSQGNLGYGVSRTATALQVDYYSLKKRREEELSSPRPNGAETATSAGFIELPPSAMTTASECVIEFENASGAKLRAHFKGSCLPDLAALGRGFWEAR